MATFGVFMSMDRCNDCGSMVDTDFDLEFYENGSRCESCAEQSIKDAVEDQRLDDPRHGQ